MSRRLGLAIAGLVLTASAGGRGARAEDAEPALRPVFFPEPDAQTAREVLDLVDNWFKDLNKVVEARDLIVRRYRLVAVPALVRVLEANANEPEVWAATLAIAALRRAEGPAPALWPALGPLVRLLREAPEWRRAFAALALGQFYGVPGVGIDLDPPSAGEDGPRGRARRTMREAVAALGAALSHEHPQVRTAAALALAKTGGDEAWQHVAARARVTPPDAAVEARMALLLALALLPGSHEGRLEAALVHEEARIRAVGALGIALRAVQGAAREIVPDPPERVVALDRLMGNSKVTPAGWDGAEAVYARGSLALHGATPRTWDELYDLALAPSTKEETAVAAVQSLLFAPAQHALRGRLAEFVSRANAGLSLREPVLAAFLLMAGSDGTPVGVAACADFLRSRSKAPRGSLERDVRYHAAVGLARGLATGSVSGPARAVAVDALAEAVGPRGLVGRGERSFHEALSQVLTDSLRGALASDPEARLPAGDLARLEAAVAGSPADPHALLSRDPLDVAAHRLGVAVRRILGLESLSKPVSRDPQGNRDVNKDLVPLRYLNGWLERDPYLVRRDLRTDRGLPRPPPARRDADLARWIDR